MSYNFIDVHTFDTKWKVDIKTRFPIEVKTKLFDWLNNRIPDGKPGLNLIVVDTQKAGNFDHVHNCWADDILSEIIYKILKFDDQRQNDIINLLAEQLNDMFNTGQCPIGRTCRLYQLYLSIIKEK